jgi:signal peptidase I
VSRFSLFRVARRAAVLGFFAVWLLALRPQWMGGPALYLLVRGDSMLPSYQNGDLVVVMAQADYGVGDAVGYRVPAGEVGAGRIVVHRIVGQDGQDFVMRGDNNPSDDPTRPTRADIAGRVTLAVPSVGRFIALLLQPVVAGGLAAAVVVMAVVARSPAAAKTRQAGTGTAT